MPPEIEVFKTTTIYGALGNGVTAFTYDVYIDFIPDEIVLKYISRYDNDEHTTPNNGDPMILLRSSLVDGEILASIPRSVAFHESYNIPFPNKKAIRGTYNFILTDIDNDAPSNAVTFDTQITCTLLFIKYKK